VLRSIVEATVVLFGAEAASIALHDPATDRLVFQVAAGERGEGVVGLAIDASQGVAGYAFSTGQPLALSDVERDARFGRATAEQTGYVPRSLIAVPLVDDEGVLGVLEVLDKRADGGFDLHDIELATVFARQATVAIRSSRIERDTASLLRAVLTAADDGPGRLDVAALDAIIATEIRTMDADSDDPLWAIADQIALLRATEPGQLELVRELLAVLVRRADHGRSGRTRG
jgi:GAF domain-containing protein